MHSDAVNHLKDAATRTGRDLAASARACIGDSTMFTVMFIIM